MRSLSATIASLAAGSVTPWWSGATTTRPPGREVARPPSVGDDRQVEALVAEQGGQARGRPVAVGGDDDAVAVGQQLGQPGDEAGAVADDRPPAGGLRRPGVSGDSGDRVHRPRGVTVAQQAIRARRAGGGTPCRGRAPTSRRAPAPGRPPRPAGRRPGRACGRGSTSSTLARSRQDVGEQASRRRPATAASSPSRRTARPRRGAPTARGPMARGRRGGGRARGRRRSAISSRAGKISASARSAVDRWSLTPKRRQPVDLVAPQVDAHGGVGRGREDVDDGAAPGELAAVLDEVLAAVPEARRAGRRARLGRHAARVGRMIGSTVGGAPGRGAAAGRGRR